VLAAVLTTALVVWASAASAAPLRPGRESDATALAQAFIAAWNAHDLDAVLALFAPDAVVRERRGPVPADVWDARDPRVVRTYLEVAPESRDYDASALIWVTGRPAIAAWAAARFAAHHRVEVGLPRVDGDTVAWPFREFADPWQRLPGVGPVEGQMEAVAPGGAITRLTVVVSPASVARQQGEAVAAGHRAAAARRTGPAGDGPSASPSGLRTAAEPAGAAWPLALGGLALLAAGAAARRRRRRRRRAGAGRPRHRGAPVPPARGAGRLLGARGPSRHPAGDAGQRGVWDVVPPSALPGTPNDLGSYT
jgi:ketosteroid isomerase-like protein